MRFLFVEEFDEDGGESARVTKIDADTLSEAIEKALHPADEEIEKDDDSDEILSWHNPRDRRDRACARRVGPIEVAPGWRCVEVCDG